MRVLLTGIIAGLDDRRYIDTIVEMAQIDNLKVDIFNLIDAVEGSEKRLHRMLGTTDSLFVLTREKEYANIGMSLMESQSKNAIIRVPATMMWRGINLKLKDHEIIEKYIRPDVIVTLIDAEWSIEKRLGAIDPGTRDGFTRQLLEDGFTCRDILSWMNEEVSLSEDWARHLGIRHYVVPMSQHPLSVYKLVRHPDVKSFYVSYSMTHTHSDTTIRHQINDTIKELCEYGLVIDPQSIEIPNYEDITADDMRAAFAYTVHRDLHWFVNKVDAVVAIHPYLDRPPLSTGMMDELGHARDYMKSRYMIFPPAHVSPFTSNSYIEPHHIFQDAAAFFHTLESEGFSKLEFSPGVCDVEWAANPLS